jgi:hypothetical protein
MLPETAGDVSTKGSTASVHPSPGTRKKLRRSKPAGHLPLVRHRLQAHHVEEIEASQLGRSESETHLVPEALHSVHGHNDLPAVKHTLLDHDGHHVLRLWVEDQTATVPTLLPSRSTTWVPMEPALWPPSIPGVALLFFLRDRRFCRLEADLAVCTVTERLTD